MERKKKKENESYKLFNTVKGSTHHSGAKRMDDEERQEGR